MSGSYFDPDWTAKVTVPVKRVGERWEFFYGGDVPVKEGTLGELTLSADRITDENFRKRVMQELTVKILDEGTELRVALSDRDTNGRRAGSWPEPHPPSVPPGTTRFERIWLGPLKQKPGELPLDAELERGGLWLKIKGLERCELLGSTVQMPSSFQPAVGISLNHAFTMLSQAYEKHRISNTGNVYSRVFYQDRDKRWYPLDDLRAGLRVTVERQLLHDLWAEVEQILGWRPTPVADRSRRRKYKN
jgi:hypothetical protein